MMSQPSISPRIAFFAIIAICALIALTSVLISRSKYEQDVAYRIVRMRNAFDLLHQVRVADQTQASGFELSPWDQGEMPPLEIKSLSGESLYSWRAYAAWLNASVPLNASEPWTEETNRKARRIGPSYAFCNIGGNDAVVVANNAINGPFNDHLGIDEIPDDVIVLIEATCVGVNWMSPNDYFPSRSSIDVSCQPRDSDFLVCFMDGSIWCIRGEVAQNVLQHFFTIDGARAYDRSLVLEKYCVSRVAPPGATVGEAPQPKEE